MIQFIGIICAAISLFLGWTVFYNDRKSRANLFYFIFSIASSFWLLCNILATPGLINVEGITFRVAASLISLSSVLSLISLYIFSFHFIKKKIKLPVKALFLAEVLFLGCISFTTLNVQINDGRAEVGVLYPAVVCLQIINLLLLLVPLFRHRSSEFKMEVRRKASFLKISLLISLIPIFIAGSIIPLFGYETISNIAPGFSIIFLAIFAYAMVTRQIFDIRTAVARASAYVFSMGILLIIYTAVVNIVVYVILAGANLTDNQERFIYAGFAIVASLLFSTIKSFFDRVSNRLFYRDAYDPQIFLDKLSSILVSTIDLSELLHGSADLISDTLKSSYVKFLLLDKDNVKDIRILGHAVNVLTKTEAKDLTAFLDKLKKKVFVTENDIDSSHDRSVTDIMRSHNIGVVLRLVTHEKRIGYILIGIKRSGSPYAKQDVRLFEITSDELSLAIQNALRFEEIENFNVTLQQKVTDATRELRRTNDKLKALDEAKDEFISMASHQLRTPLTSVKGYVSMVLEGDAGKISRQQKELLGQSYTSAQRMVYLISDLLNVSRLKTGKFVIEARPTFLPDVVAEELDQVKEMASVKNIEITYDKPHEFPTINLDDTKIRQVIMNFIDNAIHYTPNGGKIVISLTRTERQLEFAVTDSGIGVPKNEQHHLFTKFYRADNAQKARPDGTGLGLFMAKKVIIASGGALIFRSQEGKGSTFGFVFPVKKT